MGATENTKKYITLLVIDLYKQTWCQNIHFEVYFEVYRKSNGDVFKLIESLLLLPVDFLIIVLKGLPMKMHDLSNINECGSTSKT